MSGSTLIVAINALMLKRTRAGTYSSAGQNSYTRIARGRSGAETRSGGCGGGNSATGRGRCLIGVVMTDDHYLFHHRSEVDVGTDAGQPFLRFWTTTSGLPPTWRSRR